MAVDQQNKPRSTPKKMIQMGTIESYETPSLAAALRSQRTTTQQDVDEYADAHGTQVRHDHNNRHHAPSAH